MDTEQNLSDRRQTLAHQPHGLRQAWRRNERQPSPSGLGRSSPRRMAVHGESQDWQDPHQPVRIMDFLRKMWFAHQLQGKGGADRPASTGRSRSPCDQHRHRGAEADDGLRPVHREGDEREAVEVKGKLLQMGIGQTMAVNLTFKQYQEKLEKGTRNSRSSMTSQPVTPTVLIAPGAATAAMASRNMDLEAENNELRMRVQQAVAFAKQAKAKAKATPVSAAAFAQQARAKATPVKKEPKKSENAASPKAASMVASLDGTVMTIPSSDEMEEGEDKNE